MKTNISNATISAGLERSDDCEHCCCCGPGEACCDCGMTMLDLNRDLAIERWTDFLDENPDDLTSPEDWPDHALVTFEQFYEMARSLMPRIAQRA